MRALTDTYRERLSHGETLDDLLPEAYATIREAARRVLGQRAYDEQVMGAAAMHFGHVVEMKTSEGKTLAAVLPGYLNALTGRGVHVATVNHYLADRDADWMGPVYRSLGLTVGIIRPDRPSAEHRAAYQADVTYGMSNEFGFDYLRDNAAISEDDLVQRGHHYAIVDEVDSVLIDEGRTPLIISRASEQPPEPYVEFGGMASKLQPGPEHDYIVDRGRHTISLTDAGTTRVEDHLGVDNLLESANLPAMVNLMDALRAKEFFTAEQDYLIQGGEIVIIDDASGRLQPGRRYPDGLHQAIEAKEGLVVRPSRQILAKITQLSYFRLYDKLAGMTGTAKPEESEFGHTFRMGVLVIPTHRPNIRTDRPDLVFRTVEAKFAALVEDVAQRHERGQPVLVGTLSVKDSEMVSGLLRQRGVPHSVLNARHHAQEAQIVAQAGRLGAVTVSTKMAGRGTDIILGGNPQMLAHVELRDRTPHEDAPEQLADAVRRWERVCADEAAAVLAVGGLCVLGSERHPTRRLDEQLRGRAGRQGDPGESQFYLSMRDDLLRASLTMVDALMQRLNLPDNVPLQSNAVNNQIRAMQAGVEARNSHNHRTQVRYDQVVDDQCKVIYTDRRRVLTGEDLGSRIEHMIDDVIGGHVRAATKPARPRDWDLVALIRELTTYYPVAAELRDLPDRPPAARPDARTLLALFTADARRAYQRKEADLDADVLRALEVNTLLTVIDREWREHLDEMTVVRDSVVLSFLSGMDPLIEYQRRAVNQFTGLLDRIKSETVGFLFNLTVSFDEAEDDASLGQRR